MADLKPTFTLRKRQAFMFALEDEPETTYSIPSLKSLSFEDAKAMTKIDDEEDIVKKGKLIRDFILKYAPGLKDKELCDMEYFEIFNAYGLNEGQGLGESKASQNS